MNTLLNTTHSFYTKFYPSLQSFTGNAISTLIIDKLEFWFSNPKYVGGFYKFIEPCSHPLYREGDSWSEELGVSRKLFAKAFDIIGIRYNSKSAYLKADDKFQGKLYASYHDRKTNRTYYVRNHEFTSQLIEKLKSSYGAVKQKIKKRVEATLDKKSLNKNATERAFIENHSLGTNPLKRSSPTSLENFLPTPAPSTLSQGRSRNGDLGRSYARVSLFIHKRTPSLETEISNSNSLSAPNPQLQEETEGMIKIWKEEVGELGVSSLSNGLLTRLQTTLRESFSSSLESWKGYCQMISSSKFLMGEAQNKFFKKAWITWAINPENIAHIRGGAFRCGDRQTNHDKAISEIDHQIKNVEIKKHHIEMKIVDIKGEARTKRKNIVKEKVKNLSDQEKIDFEKDFEILLIKENNELTKEFQKFKWKGMFISSYFDSFVREKIYSQTFKITDEENEAQIIQASGLLEILANTQAALDHLQQKKKDFEMKLCSFESMDLKGCSDQNLQSETRVKTTAHPTFQNEVGFATQGAL